MNPTYTYYLPINMDSNEPQHISYTGLHQYVGELVILKNEYGLTSEPPQRIALLLELGEKTHTIMDNEIFWVNVLVDGKVETLVRNNTNIHPI